MSYESDFMAYIADIDRLWLEMQTVSMHGLSAEEVLLIQAFQKQNDEARATIKMKRPEAIGLYSLADAANKRQMEAELRARRQGLSEAESVYRRTLAKRL